MELHRVLQGIDLFEDLSENELIRVAQICTERRFSQGQTIAKQGAPGEELFIITEGFVEILLGNRPDREARVIVSLGTGQIIGEMALLDQGPRSATVRAISDPTVVQVISRQDFEALCQEDTHIGYIVMRNLAADLSFKLRHRNMAAA